MAAAPANVLDLPLGPAAVRAGTSPMDLVAHALHHQRRLHRLALRRRREWRLLARARRLRHAARLVGSPAAAAAPSPTLARAQRLDELDAWADAMLSSASRAAGSPVQADYPAELVGLPEKDLLHAAQLGRLPPRYKRLAGAARGAGGGGKGGGRALPVEGEVLGALRALRRRLASPWVDCPGRCEVKPVTLLEVRCCCEL